MSMRDRLYTVERRDKLDRLLNKTGGFGPTVDAFTALVAKTRLDYIVAKDRIRTGGFRRFQ